MTNKQQVKEIRRLVTEFGTLDLAGLGSHLGVAPGRAKSLVVDCLKRGLIEGYINQTANQFVTAPIELVEDRGVARGTQSRRSRRLGTTLSILIVTIRFLSLITCGAISGLIGYGIATVFGTHTLSLIIGGVVAAFLAYAGGVIIQVVSQIAAVLTGFTAGPTLGILSLLGLFFAIPRLSFVFGIAPFVLIGGAVAYWLYGPTNGAIIVAFMVPPITATYNFTPYGFQ